MAKASDNVFPYLHVAPAAAPASPAAGSQRLFLDSADGNKLKRKDSSGVVTTIEGGAGVTYTAFAPALQAATTNPTLGTGGSATGRYFQNGKQVEGDIVIQFGTSGAAAGSGTYYVTFPVAANMSGLAFRVVGTAYGATGGGVNLFTASATLNSGTRMQLIVNSTSTLISHNTPAAWTNNDVLIIHFSYEAA